MNEINVFEKCLQDIPHVYIDPTSYPETAPRNGPKFSTNVASLRGGKLAKNF